MVNTNLVGGWPTPLKNHGVTSSVGMIFHSQLFLESHNPFHGSSHHQPDMLNPIISHGGPHGFLAHLMGHSPKITRPSDANSKMKLWGISWRKSLEMMKMASHRGVLHFFWAIVITVMIVNCESNYNTNNNLQLYNKHEMFERSLMAILGS